MKCLWVIYQKCQRGQGELKGEKKPERGDVGESDADRSMHRDLPEKFNVDEGYTKLCVFTQAKGFQFTSLASDLQILSSWIR